MRPIDQLILDHVPRLRRYARALTGDPGRADDLVQDCLERAYRRRHQWRAGSNLPAWLFTILHNCHVSALRRAARTPLQVPLDDAEPSLATADPGPGARDLDRALAALSPDHRTVILLVGLEGLSYEETARVLGIPVGTVMSRLARARKRLRGLLEGGGTVLRRVK